MHALLFSTLLLATISSPQQGLSEAQKKYQMFDPRLGVTDKDREPMLGKTPPTLKITNAYGISKDTKLADMKGKWVVMEFFNYGCSPCLGISIPHLQKFADTHPTAKDKLQILLVHDPSAETYEKMLPMIRGHFKNILDAKVPSYDWINKEEPFKSPILFDSTKETLTAWGIRAFPTMFIINPEGLVAGVFTGARADHLEAIDKMLSDGLK